MKTLLTFLTIALFSFSANARDVGTLYKDCKVFQSNGFNLKPDQLIPSISCFMYFRALADTGTKNCILLQTLPKNHKKSIHPDVLDVLNIMTANADIIDKQGMETVITSFINFSEKNTHQWKEFAPTFTDKFLSNNFPCKID